MVTLYYECRNEAAQTTQETEMKKQTQIAFTADKNGRPVAYRWDLTCFRWFRIGYDEAKLRIALGTAREVRYVNPNNR
jgi:hypothetical protein